MERFIPSVDVNNPGPSPGLARGKVEEAFLRVRFAPLASLPLHTPPLHPGGERRAPPLGSPFQVKLRRGVIFPGRREYIEPHVIVACARKHLNQASDRKSKQTHSTLPLTTNLLPTEVEHSKVCLAVVAKESEAPTQEVAPEGRSDRHKFHS